MDTYGQIAAKIKAIVSKGKVSELNTFPAQVKSVNGTTCTVMIDDLEVTDVRLRAVINSKSEQLLITPKTESYVLVADLSNSSFTDFAVISYSEVESVDLKIGNTEIVMLVKEGLTVNQSLAELQTNELARGLIFENTMVSFVLAFFVWIWLLFLLKDEKMTIKLASKLEK